MSDRDSIAVALRFDERGVLRDPDLHDGNLVSISVGGERSAILGVRDAAGREHILTLTDVERLRARDFCEGNIVFDVAVHDAADCPPDLLRELYDGGGAFDAVEHVRRTKQGYRVLVLTPSYGCCLLALFRRLTIAEGPVL